MDGRRANELRKVKCKMGLFDKADGSAYFEQGNTKVVAVVYGPREVARANRGEDSAQHDMALVRCQYSMATFSTGERKRKVAMDRRSTVFI